MLALPITIQQIVSSSGSIIDNLMVGSLGTNAIAAVSATNKFINIFWFTIYGLASGGAGFVAQFVAVKDYRGVKKILGLTLFFNVTVALIFGFASIFYNTKIVSFFTNDPEIMDIAGKYLMTMSVYYVLCAIPYSYSYPLRTLGRAHITMYIIFLAQLVNIVLNYCLISGNFGFPAMGVVGAALATVFSKAVETIAILTVVYKGNTPVAASLKELLSFSVDFLKKYTIIVAPLAVNEILWSIGLLVYQIIIGGLGVEAMAAYGMLAPFEQLLMTTFSGVASASLTMVGRQLGKKDYDSAYSMSIKFTIIGPVLALLIGLPFAFFAPNILSLYSAMSDKDVLSVEALGQAVYFLRILGLLMFIRVFNMICFVGIFKSAGDTIFLFLVETLSLWIVGIPLAYVAASIGLPAYVVYSVTYIEEIIKAIIIRNRLLSKKWMKTLITLD